jgi:uncharacterized protein (TIGR02300 family)
MGRAELGTKCTCTGCFERFYDLNRSPAVCPKCGVQQPPEKPRVLRPPRSTFGTGPQSRRPPVAATADAEEPADTPDVEADLDDPDEVDEVDEVDDDVEIDPAIVKPVD